MTSLNRALPLAALALLIAAPVLAQGTQVAMNTTPRVPADTTAPAEPRAAAATAAVTAGTYGLAGYGRPTFELPKQDLSEGSLQLQIGGAFAQTFQALDHSNEATPAPGTTLGKIRGGFNLASANLSLGARLARGVRVDLDSYMSSRHHNEFWVKGGYATIDASPIDHPVLNQIMKYTTVRAGMYQPNYGDAHFRRSDNGNTIRNPFIENYVLDAFTTEIGADVLVRVGNAFVMGGVTTGENKGDIKETAVDAKPAFLGKIGYDRQVSDALRFRLTASGYSAASSPSTTLFAGDRSGSRYWGVLEDTATLKAGTAFTNGRINPGFTNELTAVQVNPFVQIGSLELFGVLERATGKAAAEEDRREVRQLAGDMVYRLLNDRLYVGGRWNRVDGDFSKQTDLTVTRRALSAGWFITPNMLTKAEWVRQDYDGFAATDIRNGARFSGLLIEGVIAF
ncbi:MAG TPA: hypothetical protein VF710_05410 [Longimicrobium sp.]|jgi:hypothetical protein